MPKLTKVTPTTIKAIKPADKPVKWGVGDGLYIYVTPQGYKSWRYKYRFMNKEKVLVIGDALAISYEEAKAARLAAINNITHNIDPMTNKKQVRQLAAAEQSNTFEVVARRWHENWIKIKHISDKHAQKTWQRLEKDVIPRIGHLPIKDIDRVTIVALSKAPVDRGSLDIASRVLDTVAGVFRFASNQGLITSDPCQSMKTSDFIPTTEVENMTRISTAEVPQFLFDLEKTKMNEQIRLYLKIMMLVFVRKDELLGAKWDEFDFDAEVWHVDWQRMKSKREHEVPITPQLFELLQQLRELNPAENPVYLFPALSRKSESGIMSDAAIRNELYKMGYKPRDIVVKGRTTQWGMTIHGFRGVASTALSESTNPASPSIVHATVKTSASNNDLGKNLVVEAQLDHVMGDGSSSPYNKAEHWDMRVTMMREWADWVDAQRALGMAQFG